MSIKENLLNLLFPKDIKCICCDEELPKTNRYCLCDNCLKSLPFISSHYCKKCGESLFSLSDYCLNCKNHVERYFTLSRSVFDYDSEVINLIHNLKYNNAKYLGEYLGRFLVDVYVKNKFDVDLVVPIPLNENRLKERGYNQSYLISVPFEKELNLKIDTENFVRDKNTPTQTNLTREERKHNLDGAFKVVDKSKYKNKNILLIDDVYTTGSTMEEASKTLLKAGVKNVYCMTIAHTLVGREK